MDKEMASSKETHGNLVGLLIELEVEDQMECKSFTKITPDQFEFLFKNIS